jgi:protein-disulfide isomerase
VLLIRLLFEIGLTTKSKNKMEAWNMRKFVLIIAVVIIASAVIFLVVSRVNDIRNIQKTDLTGDAGMIADVSGNINASSENTAPKPKYILESLKVTPVAEFGAPAVPGQKNFKLTGGKITGEADAFVHVFEFMDFQCPVCGRAFREMKPVIASFPSRVQFHMVQFPLKMHPRAFDAAMAAEAANVQGKFMEYADMLFENPASLGNDDFIRYAAQLGLDVEKFKKDLKNPALRQVIEKEMKIGEDFGINGTPGFLINGKKIVGWASSEMMKNAINQEMAVMEQGIKSGVTVKDAIRAKDGGDKFVKLLP